MIRGQESNGMICSIAELGLESKFLIFFKKKTYSYLLNTVITQKGQGIYGFFDVMFSFLYRRTDFFYEMAPGENMGFFPTQAEAIVCGYFRKYQQFENILHERRET